MNNDKFLTGQLLISQPKMPEGHFSKSVILVAQHNKSGAWGVVVNRRARSVFMDNIMAVVGIEYPKDTPVYVGGPIEPTRVHVVHTLDWSSPSTLYISDNLGITGDVSILTAISVGEGPKMYRAGVGLSVWGAAQLEGEQSGLDPWTPAHQWLVAAASPELCLLESGDKQWQNAIHASVKKQVSEFF